MTNDLKTLLAELRTDHKHMASMLDFLEAVSNRLYGGREADYEMVHDVMRYMTVYPDAIHHPKEDRVYAELKAVRPDLSNGFYRIVADHRDLAQLGLKLRRDVESVLSGTIMRRNIFIADALRYVKRLRDHMHWEESDLFVRVEEMVRDGHSLVVESEVLDKPDPVFGPEVEQHFGKLYDSIQQTLSAGHM